MMGSLARSDRCAAGTARVVGPPHASGHRRRGVYARLPGCRAITRARVINGVDHARCTASRASVESHLVRVAEPRQASSNRRRGVCRSPTWVPSCYARARVDNGVNYVALHHEQAVSREPLCGGATGAVGPLRSLTACVVGLRVRQARV